MDDEMVNEGMEQYEDQLKTGNRLDAMQALRSLLVDYLVHETGNQNRCAKCQALQTRSSDIASIAAKLMKLIEETGETSKGEVVEDELSKLRNRDAGGSPPELPPPADLGTRGAPRRSGSNRSR